jgi:3-oxoacyl-[acyl-carrier-protein] synthase II
VAVTGLGIVGTLGNDVAAVTRALRDGTSGVRVEPAWKEVDGLETCLRAPVAPGLDPQSIPRAFRRSMGPQAVFASLAARQAVADAGLDEAVLRSGAVGVSIGSTMGSVESLHAYFEHLIRGGSLRGIRGTAFLQTMGHTCAANVALLLGATGRVLAPSSACTSGSQGVGAAFEAVRHGLQDVMVCGGADEAHFIAAAVFDLVGGASRGHEEEPRLTPRPFDADRDGLVVGEGAGILVLEDLERARARGARVHAEVLGYATNCDGAHMSQPQQQGTEACMRAALEDAGVRAHDVDYVNAHATATPIGDVIEAAATAAVFGDRVPVSSTKGQTGHTLGACGAIETIFTILMMREGFVAATRNLERVDPACAGIQHVLRTRPATIAVAVNNNFAFGGVNTSLVLGRADR